jgi:hypothetical protein
MQNEDGRSPNIIEIIPASSAEESENSSDGESGEAE